MEERRVLDSWKEIASYLERSIKTCRRWEHELGLPVHRLEESPKARVFAYPDELDQWIKSTQKSDESATKTKRLLSKKSFVFTVGAVLIILLIISGILLITKRTEPLDSIAILPIVNDSGDPAQEYFANSLTTLLISELYKVSALKVAPRDAIMPYKNSTKSLKEKAKELNVKALVEASVLKSGNKIRLTASLIDPYRNRIIWSDTLERQYSEILILQSELCQAIVNGIHVTISPDEVSRLVADQKVNSEAYDLYLRGYNTYNTSGIYNEALGYIEKAIKVDPNLALAHALQGSLYSEMGLCGILPEKEAYPKARRAVDKALEIDNNLAYALSMKGWLRWIMDWDFAGAENNMKKALELEPGNSDIQFNYAVYLRTMGRYDESIKAFTNLRRSLPPGQGDLLASAYLWAGRIDEGVEIAEKTYQGTPSDLHKYWLACAYFLNGNYPRAIFLMDEVLANPEWAASERIYLAIAYALSGKKDEAQAEMIKAKAVYDEKGIESEFYIACYYVAVGEMDKAIDLLSQAYKNRVGFMVNLKTYPWLHSLHGDPRYEELVKKMGFPEVQAHD